MTRSLAAGAACMIAGIALVWTATAAGREGSMFREAVSSRGGVVAAENRYAGEAGIAMLDAGGNAVDAAAAAFFAVGVTRHELCGIGGGGFLVYRGAGGETAALDFRETAPSVYEPTRGIFGGASPPFFGTGHNVAGVPGGVAGMAAALSRYGTRPLSDTIAAGERLAREGYPVSEDQSQLMTLNEPRLRLYEESARVYLKDGSSAYRPGERLVLPDLARSLALIREQGPDAFYRGQIARSIVAAMEGSGRYPGDRGTMSLADLAGYRAKWREPVSTTYRGDTIVGMPPPSSAGLATVEMLNILEGFALGPAGPASADRFHLVAEAQKIAWADRNQYVADTDFVDVPVATMTSKTYAASRRAEIARDRAGVYEPGAGRPVRPRAAGLGDEGTNTTSIAVVDAAGNAVALNCSIEQGYGSAVVAPGTGFLLNNQLTDFDGAGTANEPKPGKRPRSSMAPTIVVRDGRPVLVIGGAGGPTIIMGATNAVIGVSDFGLDVARAVDAERADARGSCDGEGRQLCLEDARVLPDVVDELRARGHAIASRSSGRPPSAMCSTPPGVSGCEYWFGTRTQAAGIDPRTGLAVAAADPRNDMGSEAGLGARGQLAPEPLRPPQLQLSVTPRHARAGARVRYVVRAVARVAGVRRGIPEALVRFGGQSARTDAQGFAKLVVRLGKPGLRRAVARRASFAPGKARVRVLARAIR